MTMLRRARSLCPACLRVVDARYVSEPDARMVYLDKRCPEHGAFRAPAWAEEDGLPRFDDWRNDTPPAYPQTPSTSYDEGCPFDCGLCPDHAQQTCCALIEVTRRCDMNCPLCYAASGGTDPDTDMAELAEMLAVLRAHGGQANVQLSGGEPTVRDDLPEIIRLVRDKGFPFVQVNTNGLRLAREAGYAGKLKQAGLDLVYLQWDGLRESTFTALRGAPYLADKERAAQNCIEAGLSVLLVVTVVRGVNDGELGDMLRKALAFGPQVRGLHVQPAAFFGRSPWNMAEAPRLTLPELMRALETQSKGMVRARDFRPPGSEHALCSFSALYQRVGDDGLEAVSGDSGCCCAPRSGARQARDFTARHWGGLAPDSGLRSRPDTPDTPGAPGAPDTLDAFLGASSLRRRFTLSAMAFQDAYGVDLERIRRCHIHIVTRDRRLVPFCMYNMTSAAGVPLYRTA